jgi:16S rRNA (cytosine1402-N4)-methyltransferase
MSSYHRPVMLGECIHGLRLVPGGVYVDVTFGGGGHSRAILEKLEGGRLIAFDQDDDAQRNRLADDRFVLVNHNFKYLKRFLGYYNALPVNGILADLGISSHQIDTGERGFSHRLDGDLDMRMSRASGSGAYNVINDYGLPELEKVLRWYGELKNSYKVAEAIVAERARGPVSSTGQLKRLLQKYAVKGQENKFFSQVFQAVRIEVNGELDALRLLLEQCAAVIAPGGRLVVMSYHSLEDRLVKNYMATGDFGGKEVKDMYGNRIRPFKPLGKVLVAGAEEVEANPRSRSAKLRIAEKT